MNASHEVQSAGADQHSHLQKQLHVTAKHHDRCFCQTPPSWSPIARKDAELESDAVRCFWSLEVLLGRWPKDPGLWLAMFSETHGCMLLCREHRGRLLEVVDGPKCDSVLPPHIRTSKLQRSNVLPLAQGRLHQTIGEACYRLGFYNMLSRQASSVGARRHLGYALSLRALWPWPVITSSITMPKEYTCRETAPRQAALNTETEPNLGGFGAASRALIDRTFCDAGIFKL